MVVVQKVEESIKFAIDQEVCQTMNEIKWSCIRCWNRAYTNVDVMELHLYKQGFRRNYYKWVCHGETFDELSHPSSLSNFQVGENPM